MLNVAAAKIVRHNSDEESFEFFSGMKVQLVFGRRGFYEIDHKKTLSFLNKFDITPISIHYPSSFTVDDLFIDNIKMLRDAYHQTLFTLHPKFDSLDHAVSALRAKEKEISELGVILAYENMPGPKGAWCCYPQLVSSFGFPFTRLTFDTTHLEQRMDDVQEISALIDKTAIIHLSNVIYDNGARKTHLPFDKGERDLVRFLKFIKEQNYDGQTILEYAPTTASYVRDDVKQVEEMLR